MPLCNIASVWALARHAETHPVKELLQNPLLLATVGGVLYSLSGLPLPELLQMLMTRMGSASLACGLLCVGAALTFTNVQRNAPKLLEHYPAIVWEDQDECLEVRPEDVEL